MLWQRFEDFSPVSLICKQLSVVISHSLCAFMQRWTDVCIALLSAKWVIGAEVFGPVP